MGCCEHSDELSEFIKAGHFLLAQGVLGSQEGLCCIEVINTLRTGDADLRF
jgi:hypothetical protein